MIVHMFLSPLPTRPKYRVITMKKKMIGVQKKYDIKGIVPIVK